MLAFILFALYCSSVFAVLTEESLSPFIRNFSPDEHLGDASNACVVQDKRGVIFVGNAQGILEFDGVQWRYLPTPRKVSVKSLACDRYGRVFVGAEDDVFGFLKPDSKGKLEFHPLQDLIASLNVDFDVFWELIPTQQHLYARSDRYFVRFRLTEDPNAPLKLDKTWSATPGNEFHVSFKAGQTIYVRIKGKGLHKIRGDEPVLVPEGELFADDRIYFVTVAPGAPVEDPDPPILIATREHGFFIYDPLARGERLRPYRTEADEYLKTHPVYRSARLPTGDFAIGTLSGGLLIIYPNGKIRRVIDEVAGLQNNSVLEAYPDAQGGIWLALDYGVSYIEPMPAAFTKQSIFDGKRRLVNQTVRHKGRLYIATTIGVCVGKYEPAGSIMRFVVRVIPGLNSICPALLSVDDELWVGSDEGLFVYDELRGFRNLDPTLDVKALYRHGNKIYVGLLSGMAVYEKLGGTWVRVPAPKLKGEIYSLAVDTDGSIWAGAFNFGYYKIKPSGQVVRYTFKHKVGGWYRVFNVKGNLLFATPKGVYREEGARLVPHPDYTFSEQVHHILEYGSETTVIHYEADGGKPFTRKFDAKGKLMPTSFSHLDGWILNHALVEKQGVLWLAGPKGLVRYEPTDSISPTPFPPMLRKLTAKRDSTLFWGAFANEFGGIVSVPSGNFRFHIPYALNSIRVEFGVPVYRQSGPLHFQFYLEKFDEHPPLEWSSVPFKEYTNLPEGRYTLWVTVKDEQGSVGQKATLSFEVAAPWNRTVGFYSLAVVALLTLMLLAYKYFSAPIQQRNKLLDEDNRHLSVDLSAKSVELRRLDEVVQQKNTEIARLAEAQVRIEERNQELAQRLAELEAVMLNWTRFAGLLRDFATPDLTTVKRRLPFVFAHYHSASPLENHFWTSAEHANGVVLVVGRCHGEHAPPVLSGLFAVLTLRQIFSRKPEKIDDVLAAFSETMEKHAFRFSITVCGVERENITVYGSPAFLVRNGKVLEVLGKAAVYSGDKVYLFSDIDVAPQGMESLDEHPFVEHPFRFDELYTLHGVHAETLIVGFEWVSTKPGNGV